LTYKEEEFVFILDWFGLDEFYLEGSEEEALIPVTAYY
jgi:hypothetical protein